MADVYANNARKLWASGWKGVLPLPAGRKHSPPDGYTGYSGVDPSWPDIQTWIDTKPNGNIALRMPDGVIGLDVDAYGGKTGGRTLAHALKLWGPLPHTWASTSRLDGVSGIRLYRVPRGTRLVTKLGFPELNLGHIEIVQRGHRYVVAPPSIHPDTGKPYQWLDTEDLYWTSAPGVDDLPVLPARWLEALTAPATPAAVALVDVDVSAMLAELGDAGDDMEPAVYARCAQALEDLAPGATESRHDTTLAHVLALLRLAEQGELGVAQALRKLGEAYVSAVGGDRSDARMEYNRMVTNQRGHQMIAANPSPVSKVTVVGMAELSREVQKRQNQEEVAAAQTDTRTCHEGVSDQVIEEVHSVDPYQEFWSSRESLTAVRQFALARMCSPWAVLGVVMARVLATVPPWVTLPPLIGGAGSLNFFVSLVARSGGGKGASESAAAELMPAEVYVSPVGSGEGLAHQYAHFEKGEQIIDRHSVLFSVPEIDTLTALGGRSGATILSKLREAFSGEELGFGYADASKRIKLGRHGYRLCMVVGVQPARAGAILRDGDGGTPQRFVWLPATDPQITLDNRPSLPQPLELFDARYWAGSLRSIRIPGSVERAILENHVKRQRGEGDALDGHSLFVREKTAFALAVLDGREYIGEEDWELSGMVMGMSEKTRSDITEELRIAASEENIERGKSAGQQRAVAQDVIEEHDLLRVIGSVLRSLANGPKRSSEVYRGLWSKKRDYYDPALRRLIEEGRVTVDTEGIVSLS